jgi:hypothetical protein
MMILAEEEEEEEEVLGVLCVVVLALPFSLLTLVFDGCL